MIYLNYKVIPKSDLYVACSGGIDSIAAVHYIRYKFTSNFQVIHINNELCDEDHISESRVKQLCNDLKLDLHHFRYPIKGNSNLEHKCRESRIEVYRKFNGSITVCHHIDDAIESYLMKCFTGKPDYIPIPLVTTLTPEAKLIRPFIPNTRKNDFLNYVGENGLFKYVTTDPLNATSRRGWIRNDLMPIIGNKYPGLAKVVRKMYTARS